MINRHPKNGRKLDVAGLNEITVLIDRSETALTEVAMNSWSPGLDGPPHAHDRKEQNFLVTSGRGEVVIGGQKFPAEPGSFFYVPAGAVHQTINRDPNARLDYFLFNAFLDADKEGHVSFADHIDQVKETRRKQAKEQRADTAGQSTGVATAGKHGKGAVLPAGDSASAVMLLDRNETERCEAFAWRLAAAHKADLAADSSKEQTLFVVSGTGNIRIAGETVAVNAGRTLFVPPGDACSLEAGPDGLQVVSFGTVLTR